MLPSSRSSRKARIDTLGSKGSGEPGVAHSPAIGCSNDVGVVMCTNIHIGERERIVSMSDFLVKRDDLRKFQIAESGVPELEPGQALLRVERFGLTANN